MGTFPYGTIFLRNRKKCTGVLGVLCLGLTTGGSTKPGGALG
ncbi:unnamed protein product, partial [Rotaria magnacalcarata]